MPDFEITVYYGTNRNRTNDDEYFGSEIVGSGAGCNHPALFRVGRAIVDVSFAVTSSEVLGEHAEIRDLEVFKETPSKDGTGFDTVGTTRLVPELAKAMRVGKADILCVIPGFDYTFRESIERAALLAALYSKPKSPPLIATLFSWPSDGRLSIGGYLSDRIDAELSGLAIARAMDRLSRLYHQLARRRASDDECGQRIHLVAHSMGAHALKHAIMKYPCLPGARMVRFFDTAILTAADTERDALERADKMASGFTSVASPPAVYASRRTLPCAMQHALPAGWLAFAGRGSNPLAHDERVQIISSSFPGLGLAQSGPEGRPPYGRCTWSPIRITALSSSHDRSKLPLPANSDISGQRHVRRSGHLYRGFPGSDPDFPRRAALCPPRCIAQKCCPPLAPCRRKGTGVSEHIAGIPRFPTRVRRQSFRIRADALWAAGWI